MSFDIVFTVEAETEYYDTIQYYEKKRHGLGLGFVTCFEDAIIQLQQHPHRYPVLYKDRHYYPMRRFPYYVIYIIQSQQAIIVQLFHKRMNLDARR